MFKSELLCDEGVGIGGGLIVVAAWGVCGGPRWPMVPGDTWLNCSDFFFFFTRTVITARLGNAPERWVVSAQHKRRQQWARPKKRNELILRHSRIVLFYCHIAILQWNKNKIPACLIMFWTFLAREPIH